MTCEEIVAIVTGAAGKGMGRSIALTLAREGAPVVVNYPTSFESATAIVSHIEKQGGRACAFPADVTRQDQCKKLVDSSIETFGRVNICIIGPAVAGTLSRPTNSTRRPPSTTSTGNSHQSSVSWRSCCPACTSEDGAV